jgi:hypothetical protein
MAAAGRRKRRLRHPEASDQSRLPDVVLCPCLDCLTAHDETSGSTARAAFSAVLMGVMSTHWCCVMRGFNERVVSARATSAPDNVDDPKLALGNLAQSEASAYCSANP